MAGRPRQPAVGKWGDELGSLLQQMRASAAPESLAGIENSVARKILALGQVDALAALNDALPTKVRDRMLARLRRRAKDCRDRDKMKTAQWFQVNLPAEVFALLADIGTLQDAARVQKGARMPMNSRVSPKKVIAALAQDYLDANAPILRRFSVQQTVTLQGGVLGKAVLAISKYPGDAKRDDVVKAVRVVIAGHAPQGRSQTSITAEAESAVVRRAPHRP